MKKNIIVVILSLLGITQTFASNVTENEAVRHCKDVEMLYSGQSEEKTSDFQIFMAGTETDNADEMGYKTAGNAVAGEGELVSNDITVLVGCTYRMFIKTYSDKIIAETNYENKFCVKYISDDTSVVSPEGPCFRAVAAGTCNVRLLVSTVYPGTQDTFDESNILMEKTFSVTVTENDNFVMPFIDFDFGAYRKDAIETQKKLGNQLYTDKYFEHFPRTVANNSEYIKNLEVIYNNSFENPVTILQFSEGTDQLIAGSIIFSGNERVSSANSSVCKYLQEHGFKVGQPEPPYWNLYLNREDGSVIKATWEMLIIDNVWYACLNLTYENKGGIIVPEKNDSTNCISIKDTKAFTGSQVTVPVELTNCDEITGLQFDMYLPYGVTVAKDADGLDMVDLSEDRTSAKKHTLASNIMSDGALRVLCYSLQNHAFRGNGGNVINIKLDVSPDMVESDYVISLKNVILATPEAKKIEAPDTTSVMKVIRYLPGDVNNDHMFDVSDVSGVITFILGMHKEGLIKEAADVNKDGNIDISDVAALVNIIITDNNYHTAKYSAMSGYETNSYDGVTMSALPFSITPGGDNDMSLCMDNLGIDVTGLQFDMYLPDGLTMKTDGEGLYNISLGSRTDAKKHVFECRKQNDGAYRFIEYSANNNVFKGENGDVMSFTLHAGQNIEVDADEIMLRNIVVATPDAVRYTPNDVIVTVNYSKSDGITGIENAVADALSFPADIYTVEGNLVKKNAENLDGLAKGIYIVNNIKIVK